MSISTAYPLILMKNWLHYVSNCLARPMSVVNALLDLILRMEKNNSDFENTFLVKIVNCSIYVTISNKTRHMGSARYLRNVRF